MPRMHPGLEPDPFMAFVDPAGADDIYVERDWKPKVGDPVPQCPDIFIGEKFGSGALSMNTIFDLVDKDGNTVGEALKVCKQTMSARRSLAHEWKIFKDLALLGEEHPAARSHMLQAHRVLKLHDDSIVGIIMEKANGKNVVKTLQNPDFCNVRYVIALLRDLLVALDVAQRVLGFAHYDLKLDNVMEHWSCCPDPEASRKRVLVDSWPQFKLFDFGTAVIYPDPFSVKVAPDAAHLAAPGEARPEAAEHLKRDKRYGSSDKPGIITHSAKEKLFEFSEPFFCVRIYHMYWKQRGDVYRVLHALCRLLDNRTWPVEDLELVSLLITVLERCTNSRRLKAHFVPKAKLLHKLKLDNSSKQAQHQRQQAARAMSAPAPAARTFTLTTPAAVAEAAAAAPGEAVAPGTVQQLQQQGSHGVARINVQHENNSMLTSNSAAPGAGLACVTPDAAAAGTPRRCIEDVHRSPSELLVPGVAYARLSPPPSPLAATAEAQQGVAFADAVGAAEQRGNGGVAATGGRDQHGLQTQNQIMNGGRNIPAAAKRAAAVSDEGCRLDPAAVVVEQQPLAPVVAQSVLGSRKALKGVTAQQLLAEPVVQSLLRKLEA